jgi:carboxylesterase
MTIGLFCIPGYTEIGLHTYGYFSRILTEHGFDFYISELQAHGIEEDINDFNYKLCLQQVEREYLAFLGDFDVVYIIGFSMGGVIAAHLASRYGCDKLVMVAPAFKYGKATQIVKDFLHTFQEDNQYPTILDLFRASGEERNEIIARFMHEEFASKGAAYQRMFDRLGTIKPTSFLNFTRLVAFVKKDIKIENIPTRIYQSENDELIPVESALWIFKHIKGEDKRLTFMSGPRHRILSSNVKEEVTEDVIRFLFGLDLRLTPTNTPGQYK